MVKKIINGVITFFMVLLILIVYWSFLPMVCYTDVHAEVDPLVSEPQIFKEESDGGAVYIKPWETFNIVLEVKSGTGYRWQVMEINTSILKPGDIEFKPKSELLGGPSEQILPFTALEIGETVLKLGYKRPWEKKPPLDTFVMHIKVTE